MKAQADTLTNVLAAAAIGVLQLGVAISLAALVFSGPLSDGAGRAAAGFVLGTAFMSLIVGTTSKMTVVTAGAQDTAAIMVAAVAAAIVASPELRDTEMIPTVVVMIALCGVATGVLFWVLGQFGLTSFVRFLPTPVVSGFTAGTGWLLVRGGIEVMHGEEISLRSLDQLLAWQQFKFLVPGLALALVMLLVISNAQLPNTLVSVAILGGTILFHIFGRSFSSFDRLEAQGWFIGPLAADSSWAPIGPGDFEDTNWTVLLNNAPLILAVVAVSVIGLLLNLSGLEGTTDTRIDMNSEMRSAGIANLLTGVGGGLVGYHLLGDTLLGRQIGARGRIVPMIIAAMASVTFVIGPGLIAQAPRAIAGGVLGGLGISMLVAWARLSLPRMNLSDQLLSGLILLIIAVFGVLVGVGAGVAVAAVVFIVKYSRINPVRHIIEAAGSSTVERNKRDQQVLADTPHSIMAFELHGYLFFGSTTGIRRQVDERMLDSSTKYLIVDFAHVSGIDSTASSGLMAIANQVAEHGVITLWSGLRPTVAAELERNNFALARSHRDLDHAIAWCEDQIVATLDVDPYQLYGQAHSPFDEAIMDALSLPSVLLAAGETLISAGATDTDAYFVESGTLTAWLVAADGHRTRIRQVLPGAALGEISFCTGAPRTATVVADSDAVIRVLTRERFDEITKTDPQTAIAVQQELLGRMGSRVSSTTAMVRDLLK